MSPIFFYSSCLLHFCALASTRNQQRDSHWTVYLGGSTTIFWLTSCFLMCMHILLPHSVMRQCRHHHDHHDHHHHYTTACQTFPSRVQPLTPIPPPENGQNVYEVWSQFGTKGAGKNLFSIWLRAKVVFTPCFYVLRTSWGIQISISDP